MATSTNAQGPGNSLYSELTCNHEERSPGAEQESIFLPLRPIS